MPPLLKLILIRLGLGVLTLLMVSVVVFAATQLLPGDPAQAILGKEAADKARYEALRRELNLDQPLYAQYFGWLGGVVAGDMGTSLVQKDVPVTELLSDRLLNSATLVFLAALLSIPLSILIGSLSAVWRDSRFDSSTNLVNLMLAALPEFVIGHHPRAALRHGRLQLAAGGLAHRPADPAVRSARSLHPSGHHPLPRRHPVHQPHAARRRRSRCWRAST